MSFFILLLVCLGAGMAIGRGSADVLFLKRYGIEYLPVMYLILSIVLAVCFTLYAAFVDRIASERFFYFLLSIEVMVLLVFWAAIFYVDIQFVYPAYFIFYELVSELVLVHATFYIAQSLDTLQSKRLTSLILAGYQLGMIVGGVFFATMMPSIGVEHSMLVWSGLLLLSIVMLLMWHSEYGVSPFFIPPSKIGGRQINVAIQEVTKGLQFVRQSSLLRNSSAALFFMVLMFYVLTYSVNKIYSESFESEAELAMFFGMLVAGTNLLAVVMQAFVSGRVIEKIGVRKAKLIYPMMTVISYLLLLISPGFYMAMIASINNGSIMPAFRNPSRQMFFNVLPDYMKGRARATSVALVLPVALFVCGALILYLQTSQNPSLIIYFGFVCALMYWFFCYRMGKVYSRTLIENLKEKLYLPENISDAAYKGSSKTLFPILLKGWCSDDEKVCVSYAELLIKVFPEEAMGPILHRLKSVSTEVADRMIRMIGNQADESVLSDLMVMANTGDNHLKATIYELVLTSSKKDYQEEIDAALSDKQERIRACGIKTAIKRGSGDLYDRGMQAWYEMLKGSWQQKMAVIDMQPLMRYVDEAKRDELRAMYEQVFLFLLDGGDSDRKVYVYKAMAKWADIQSDCLSNFIKQDVRSIDPGMRHVATSCLHMLPDKQEQNEFMWMMLGDGHAGVRKMALQVMQGLYKDKMAVYYEWLLKDGAGSPRAQKVLLGAMIKHGVEHKKLKHVADRKYKNAAELLGALKVIGKSNKSMGMVRTVLEERLTETIDLVLFAVEPIVEKGVITVVRAGLLSNEPSSVASAHELLQTIEDKQIAERLNSLIDRNYDKAIEQCDGNEFLDIKEALQWCVDYGDAWMRECSSKALSDYGKEVYA